MRRTVMIILALLAIRLLPRTARREARMVELVTLLFAVTIASGAPNSSKAYATEARTASLETRVGNLEQGNFASIRSGSVISQLQAGFFSNVPGGAVTMTGTVGPVTLHTGALTQFTDGNQTAFLAGLHKTQSPGGVGLDPNSGGSWASGERANYINDLRSNWNALLGTFINNGFMNPA